MNAKLIRCAVVTSFIAASACAIYIISLHEIFQLNPFGRFKYLYIGLYALFFAGGMMYFRDKLNQGMMSGQQGLGFGFVLNATASLLYGGILLLYLQAFDADQSALNVYLEESLALLENSKEHLVETLSQQDYDTTRQNLLALTPKQLAFDQLTGIFLVGMFHTFLFMLFFKRSK
ncbi:DUF4199 family protein [Rapidithrix thailandica]|uniref:DUF4199 family protein n=1 Tax=Rapidithrix thailandica TaxID=413964 RepID=A0AAW9S302_9BACT